MPEQEGGYDDHVWVAAIADQQEVETRLWLSKNFCDAQFEPLCAHDLMALRLETGEVRRILIPASKRHTLRPLRKVEEPEQRPEEQAVTGTASEKPKAKTVSEQEPREFAEMMPSISEASVTERARKSGLSSPRTPTCRDRRPQAPRCVRTPKNLRSLVRLGCESDPCPVRAAYSHGPTPSRSNPGRSRLRRASCAACR